MFAEIRETARQGVEKHLGNETNAFFTKAEARLNKYTNHWQLTQVNYMYTYTLNLLFECESAIYGPCVLKMCVPGPEVATEANCLRVYDGRGYVKLWDHSLEDDILLLERVTPGSQMWDVTDYKERAQLMANVINNLPFIPCKQGDYPTYRTWMEGIHSKLTKMGSVSDALFYLNEALRIYDELKQRYNRSCLLHGDMHQENMLLNQQGSYTIIDPKGVVDDPVMETARFLMNETPCEAAKIYGIVSIMSPIIGIPESDMLKSMFIDAALGNCWTLENYFPTQEAFEESKRKAIEMCRFVYNLLPEGHHE